MAGMTREEVADWLKAGDPNSNQKDHDEQSDEDSKLEETFAEDWIMEVIDNLCEARLESTDPDLDIAQQRRLMSQRNRVARLLGFEPKTLRQLRRHDNMKPYRTEKGSAE